MIARSIRGLFAATALMTVAATGVQAQEATKGIGATAGVALPMGDFGDIAGLGFHIGGQYAMPLQNALGLRFNLDYGRYGLENNVDGNTSLLGGVVDPGAFGACRRRGQFFGMGEEVDELRR